MAARRLSAVVLLFLLLAFNALSIGEMLGDTCTVDEAIHLLAGYKHLTERDFGINPEHPPLQKMLAAVPIVLFGLAGSPQDPPSFLYDSPAPEALLAWGRAPTLLWGNVLILSVFGIASGLYGRRAGLAAAVASSFCPTLIAHSHFVTTDVPVAALALLAVNALWGLTRRPTLFRCLLAGVLLGASLCTKFSAVVIVPLALWFGLVRLLLDAKARWGDDRWRALAAGCARGGVWTLAVGLAAFYTVWAVYGFRFSGSPDRELQIPLRMQGWSGELMHLAIAHKVLPEAYLKGLGIVQDHSAFGHKAYALGRYSTLGWWWYFPLAFAVKVPLSLLAMIALGFWSWARRTARGYSKDFFIAQFVLVYGGFSVASRLNIGFRHLLPILPMLYILAGGLLYPTPSARAGRWRWAVAGLLLWTAAETIAGAPHHLSYFNLPSRWGWERHDLLVDSNLDWGQDLGRLKRFMDERGLAEIKLSYFGNGSPRRLGLRHVMLPFGNWYSHREREWTYTEQLRPGDYLAVSATNFVGVLEDSHRRYYRDRLKTLRPIAAVGHSILVFRIPQDWRE